ncbi:MAG: hypothetical protein JW909_07485 [Planctomycetes bacterium]|nr:hypothetical protein [Planctomycetota bacterium]
MALTVPAVLVMLGASRVEATSSRQEREELLEAGEYYAKDDMTGFMSALSAYVERNGNSYWRFDAKILHAMVLMQKPTQRETARKMLREVSLDAREIAHGPLARHMIGRSYEEDGNYAQALKEYGALAAYPPMPDRLERSVRLERGYRRSRYFTYYPTFITNTEAANRLFVEAAARLAVMKRVLPAETGGPAAPALKITETNEALVITPSQQERKSAVMTYILTAPAGKAVRTMAVSAVIVEGRRYGKASFTAVPVYPVLPESRPSTFQPDPMKAGATGATMRFDTPVSVMEVNLTWEGLEIDRWQIITELAAEHKPRYPEGGINLLPVMGGGSVPPFARGAANIRLRYDRQAGKHVLLMALPEEAEGRPDTAPSLYGSESRDGRTWTVPEKLDASGLRSDKWPDMLDGQRSCRTVWVSDRRGSSMEEVFIGEGASAATARISGYIKDDFGMYADFPAGCHITASSPVLVRHGDRDLLFYVARAISKSHVQREDQTVRGSGIYYVDLTAGTKAEMQTVLSTGSVSLDRYLGKPEPGDDSVNISGDAPISVVAGPDGGLLAAWVSSTGKACVSSKAKGRDDWKTERIVLPGDERVHEIELVPVNGSPVAVASLEGRGVVVFARDNRNWTERATVFKEATYPYRISASVCADGKVLVAGVVRGVGATFIRTARVDVAAGRVEP